MRWGDFQLLCLNQDLFSLSFHVLFLFNPSEFLWGWLCILHGPMKVVVQVRPPAPAGSTAGPWSGKAHLSRLVAQSGQGIGPGDAAGTPPAALLFHTRCFESPALRAFSPQITDPSHLLFPAEEKSCQKLRKESSALTVLPQEGTEFSC